MRGRTIVSSASDEMPQAVRDAATAAGITPSLWLLRLVERENGVKAEMPTGGAALDKRAKAARVKNLKATIKKRRQKQSGEKS